MYTTLHFPKVRRYALCNVLFPLDQPVPWPFYLFYFSPIKS